MRAHITETGNVGKYKYADIAVENISGISAYPVVVNSNDEDCRFYLSDNFFLLKPYETKTIRITFDKGEYRDVEIDFWNGNSISVNFHSDLTEHC